MTSIPLWLKLAYTAFMAVLVPRYWHVYGPTNFLYFCDIALFLTWAGLWLENRLLLSMPAVGILLPEVLWTVDLLSGMVGLRLTGMTDYMFNPNLSLLTRGLSLFHLWLPLLLMWLLRRLGYDPRAFKYWTALAWGLMLFCFFWMPAPPPPPDRPNLPVNINYVYGLSDQQPQSWMPPAMYFLLLLAVLPVAIFWPAHWILRTFFSVPAGRLPEEIGAGLEAP